MHTYWDDVNILSLPKYPSHAHDHADEAPTKYYKPMAKIEAAPKTETHVHTFLNTPEILPVTFSKCCFNVDNRLQQEITACC